MALLLATRRCTPRERPQENTIWALREAVLSRPDSMFLCFCMRLEPPSSQLLHDLSSFPSSKTQLMMITQRSLQALRDGGVSDSNMNIRRMHAHECKLQQSQFRPTREPNTITRGSGSYIMDCCRSVSSVLLPRV